LSFNLVELSENDLDLEEDFKKFELYWRAWNHEHINFLKENNNINNNNNNFHSKKLPFF
jgi:hypothetical protein